MRELSMPVVLEPGREQGLCMATKATNSLEDSRRVAVGENGLSEREQLRVMIKFLASVRAGGGI